MGGSQIASYDFFKNEFEALLRKLWGFPESATTFRCLLVYVRTDGRTDGRTDAVLRQEERGIVDDTDLIAYQL